MLFVPGGTTGTIAAASDEPTLAFVRDRAVRARYITSVCTGSLVLGTAGLLKGRRATPHWSVIDTLAHFGAVPTRERAVRNRNMITGAGVSAGLDFGVTLVEELRGARNSGGRGPDLGICTAATSCRRHNRNRAAAYRGDAQLQLGRFIDIGRPSRDV